jgi:hypothetical protein
VVVAGGRRRCAAVVIAGAHRQCASAVRVAVFRRRHAASRRRVRVYTLQNVRTICLMRAPSRSNHARSFVPLRVERRRLETGGSSERAVAGRTKSQNRPVTTLEVKMENLSSHSCFESCHQRKTAPFDMT